MIKLYWLLINVFIEVKPILNFTKIGIELNKISPALLDLHKNRVYNLKYENVNTYLFKS